MARFPITFSAPNIPPVHAPMGRSAPKLTGGQPNWEIRQRPKQASATIWNGRSPVTQDIPVLFNGISTGLPVEADCNNLDRMQRGTPPPVVDISGPILRRDIPGWVITNIAWGDDVYKEMRGGVPVRLKQDAIVTVTEYIPVDTLETTGSKIKKQHPTSHKKPKHRTRVTKAGDTLARIALDEYGDASKWNVLKNANDFVRDPNKLPVGQTLRLPDA